MGWPLLIMLEAPGICRRTRFMEFLPGAEDTVTGVMKPRTV